MNQYILPTLFIIVSVMMFSCQSTPKNENQEQEEEEHATDIVRISAEQDEVLQLNFEHLRKMNLGDYINTTGKLQVPPQNQASISSPIGANIASIYVIEGDLVRKVDVLASLSHPDLIQLQVDYQESVNRLKYLEKDYERQGILLKNNVASGKAFQQVESEYLSLEARRKGLEAKLRLLNINPTAVREGQILNSVPVIASIDGAISQVEVNLGKYVAPQQEMFEILNTDVLHADLQVFESDITKIKQGQEVFFQINNEEDKTYMAKVSSIGKSFNESPRAVMVHATIKSNTSGLLPGIFITGKIMTGENMVYAVPEAALVQEGNQSFIFIVSEEEEEGHVHGKGSGHKEEKEHAHGQKGHDAGKTINLKMIEVISGVRDRGFVEVKPLQKLDSKTLVAQHSAYYLMAEMKKGEAEH